jgi:hypothetical protein
MFFSEQLLWAQSNELLGIQHALGLKTTFKSHFNIESIVGISYKGSMNKWSWGATYAPSYYDLSTFRLEGQYEFKLHESKRTSLYLQHGFQYAYNTESRYYKLKDEYVKEPVFKETSEVDGSYSFAGSLKSDAYKTLCHGVSTSLGIALGVQVSKHIELNTSGGFLFFALPWYDATQYFSISMMYNL